MADESKPKPVSLEELMVSTLAKLVIAKGIITEEFKCRASELSTRAEANALSPCWLDQLFLLENSQTSTAVSQRMITINNCQRHGCGPINGIVIW